MAQSHPSLPRLTSTRPSSNLSVPAIPQPVHTGENQLACLVALKAGVESLAGQRGDADGRAVTFKDLIQYGILTRPAVSSDQGAIVVVGGGTITEVIAGIALDGGGTTGSVTLDLEIPVTIAHGGTGATTAAAALAALGGAPLVSPVFTGDPRAPTPLTADNDTSIATTAYVKAQGYVTGGPYLPLTSGTLTGNLVIATASYSTLTLNNISGSGAAQIQGQRNGVIRWLLRLASDEAESSGNVGSNFIVQRYNDAGGFIGDAFQINRATGDATFGGNLALTGNYIGLAGYTGAALFGSSGPLLYVDVNWIISKPGSGNLGWLFWDYNQREVMRIDSSGLLTLNSTGNAMFQAVAPSTFFAELRLNNSAGDWQILSQTATYNGELWIYNSKTGGLPLKIEQDGKTTVQGVFVTNGIQTRAGVGGVTGANQYNIYWTGAAQLWIDSVNAGNLTLTSDYRIKENIVDLPSTWDRVKALRPVAYTIKEHAELLTKADPMEWWGFIAHELQETLTKTAATGYKDAPDTLQSPNVMVLLAPLTRALQEAMSRIEKLEARLG